jgi:hypothetical protein
MNARVATIHDIQTVARFNFRVAGVLMRQSVVVVTVSSFLILLSGSIRQLVAEPLLS